MERKYVDTGLVIDTLAGALGATQLIATIPQGTNIGQRIGRECTIQSVECNFTLYAPQVVYSSKFMIALVWDRQPNKALATYSDIFDQGPVAANSVWNFKNRDNQKRFQILKIWRKVLIGCVGAGNSPADSQVTDRSVVDIHYYRKMNHKVQFGTAGSGDIGDITTGAFIMATCADLSNGATGAVEFNYNIRVTFVDP